LILTLCFIDCKKKRKLTTKPFLSFLIPCYNHEENVKETIESIYNCYDKSNFEIIVVNDGSTDDSLEKLKEIQTKYAFTLVNNKKNMGKACSLNNACKLAKSEILFFLDADVILNKRAVNDILARLQEGISAVSSPCQPRNTGFLPLMQGIECNMMSFLQGAQNHFSTFSLWGGCFAVKKKTFEEVGGLSENAIIEDADLALKLRERGYKVEQSFYSVGTYVPKTIQFWFKQRIRWSSGSAQNFIKHFKVWLQNPLIIFFSFLFFTLSICFAISLARQITFFENIINSYSLIRETTTRLLSFEIIGFYYGAILLKNLVAGIYFTAFSLPYIAPMIRKFKDIYKALYVIPFSLIYLPVFSTVSIIGFIIGIARYKSLNKGERSW